MKHFIHKILLIIYIAFTSACQSGRSSQITKYIWSTSTNPDSGRLEFPLDEIQQPNCFLLFKTNILKKTNDNHPSEIKISVFISSGSRELFITSFFDPKLAGPLNPPLTVRWNKKCISEIQITGGDGAEVWSKSIDINAIHSACKKINENGGQNIGSQ